MYRKAKFIISQLRLFMLTYLRLANASKKVPWYYHMFLDMVSS